MRCRNLYRQCQKPGEPNLSRDEYGGYLRKELPILALGIKAAEPAPLCGDLYMGLFMDQWKPTDDEN